MALECGALVVAAPSGVSRRVGSCFGDFARAASPPVHVSDLAQLCLASMAAMESLSYTVAALVVDQCVAMAGLGTDADLFGEIEVVVHLSRFDTPLVSLFFVGIKFSCVRAGYQQVLGGALALFWSFNSWKCTAFAVFELQTTRAVKMTLSHVHLAAGFEDCMTVIAPCKPIWMVLLVVILLWCCIGLTDREGLTARVGFRLQRRAVQLVVFAIRMRTPAISIVNLGLTARVGATTSLRSTRNYGMLRHTKNVPSGNYGMPWHTKNVPSRIYGTSWSTKNVPGWNYGMPPSAKNDPPQ